MPAFPALIINTVCLARASNWRKNRTVLLALLTHLFVDTKSTLNQASANLYDAHLEAFPMYFLPKMSFQKCLEDGQQGGRTWHSNGEDQEVPLEARVDLGSLKQKMVCSSRLLPCHSKQKKHGRHIQPGSSMRTWKLPAVGFIAATY